MLAIIPQLAIGATDLAAAFLFMYGLKRMSSPVTAPSGIFVAGIGMAAAVVASFLYAFGVERGSQALFDGEYRACHRGARPRRRPRLVERPQGGDDIDAADGGALQWHGRRRRGCHRRGGTVRRQGPGSDPACGDADRRADRRGFAVRLADRLGQARPRHQEAAAGTRPAGLQRGGHARHSWRRRLHRLRHAGQCNAADRHARAHLPVLWLARWCSAS